MPTTIRIHVFNGDQTELLPTMCMFCAQPLAEDEFQRVAVQFADGLTRPLPMPICSRDRKPGGLIADGQIALHTATMGTDPVGVLIAHHLRQHQERAGTTVTILNIHDQFAAELERLRHLTPKEYDALMAEANNAFIAKIAEGSAEKLLSDEELAEIARRESEDVSTFGMDGAASQADLSVEFTRKNSRKMLTVWLIVGAISVVLVTCITGSIGAYLFWSRKAAPTPEEIAKKKELPPPKEIEARIKNIDREQRTIKLLVRHGVSETFRITPETEFRDSDGKRLPQGLDAPELRENEMAFILPTADRRGLQYLKLTR
jgi:hypothetical protein